MKDDHTVELRAMASMVEACRTKADAFDVPAVSHILHRAGEMLAGHVARAEKPTIPRGPALSVPRQRPTGH